MAQSNDNTTRIIFRTAKAACKQCGGWTTFGGMSQHAECLNPRVCAERRLQWLEQTGDFLERLDSLSQRLVNMLAALTDAQRAQYESGKWDSKDAQMREVMALRHEIVQACATRC